MTAADLVDAPLKQTQFSIGVYEVVMERSCEARRAREAPFERLHFCRALTRPRCAHRASRQSAWRWQARDRCHPSPWSGNCRFGGIAQRCASAPADTEVTVDRLGSHARYQLLKKLLPGVGNMNDPSSPINSSRWNERVRSQGFEVVALDVRNNTDLSAAFDLAIKKRGAAMRVGQSGIARTHQRLVIDLAAQHKPPAFYPSREFVENGGLISYGVSYSDLYFRAASFVSKILNGAPAISPWSNRPNSSWLINLQTAKALGLTIPPALLARADEVIE